MLVCAGILCRGGKGHVSVQRASLDTANTPVSCYPKVYLSSHPSILSYPFPFFTPPCTVPPAVPFSVLPTPSSPVSPHLSFPPVVAASSSPSLCTLAFFSSPLHPFLFSPFPSVFPDSLCLSPLGGAEDYKSELREQLPLIAGSAAAGVVFIVSLVAISIVCRRYMICPPPTIPYLVVLFMTGYNDLKNDDRFLLSLYGLCKLYVRSLCRQYNVSVFINSKTFSTGRERTPRMPCTVTNCSITALGEVS